MSNTDWVVEGRSFKYKKEYLEALSDKKEIEKIKEKFAWDDLLSITKLKNKIEQDKFSFQTLVGKDFEDDVFAQFDLLRRLEEKKIHNKKNNKIDNYKKSKKIAHKEIHIDDFDEDMKSRILYELKIKERKRRLILIIFSLIALISLSYFFIYDYMQKRTTADVTIWAQLKEKNVQTNSGKQFEYVPNIINDEINIEDLEILEEYKILYEKNKTLIGWIKIDDTYIDYPVLQTVDNEYYLNYNFNQEKDVNGCIFLDYQSDYINRDTNLIIYGHNMRSGKMFGSLSKYEDQSYYEKHSEIQFDTLYDKGIYKIMFVFHGQIYKKEDITFKYYQFYDAKTEKEFNSYMESMNELSLYNTGITASYGDQLITLSTCDGSDITKRFVVVAKRIK